MAHSALPVLPAGARHTARPSGGPRRLDLVWLELTGHCNLRCAQCYTNSSPATPHRSLPTARWLSLLEEIAAAGGRLVQLTGGEPTTHPDLLALAEKGISLELGVEVYTNGTLLDAATLDRFAELGVALAMSLHSHVPEVHDAITRTPGSHAAVLGAIQGAVRRGLDLRVEAVLMAENADHGPALEALVRDLGVLRPLGSDAVRPTGRGRSADAPAEGRSCTSCESRTFDLHHAAAGPLTTCWDGKLAVDPGGDVFPCVFARAARVGNVADTPLSEVLAGEALRGLWSLTVDDVAGCDGCDRKASCFDCRALPLMSLGDVTARSPRCDYVPPARRPRPPEGPWRLSPGVLEATCGGEPVLLDPGAGALHRLNETAALILRGLGRGAAVGAVARELAEVYGVPDAEVRPDVVYAAGAFVEAGLLVGPAPEAGLQVGPAVEAGLRVGSTAAPPEGRDLGATPAKSPGPRAAPRAPSPGVKLLDCAGVPVTLACDDDAWALLEPLISTLAVSRVSGPARRLEVVGRRSAPHLAVLHHLFLDGRWLDAVRHPAGLRSAVEHALCELAADGPQQVSCEGAVDGSAPETPPAEVEAGPPVLRLHAAAVAGPGGAAVIPGAAGTGKSLLALHAAAAGLGYLSDELATVGPELRVRPFAKAVTVKGTGLHLVPPVLQPRLVAPDVAHDRWPGWLPLAAAAPARLSRVVLPVRAEVPARAARPSPAEVLEHLVTASFDLGRRPSPPVFEALCRLAELPAVRLDTRDLPAAGRRLAALLGEDAPPADAAGEADPGCRAPRRHTA